MSRELRKATLHHKDTGLRRWSWRLRSRVRKYVRNSVYTVRQSSLQDYSSIEMTRIATVHLTPSALGFDCRRLIQGALTTYLAAVALFSSEKSSRGRGGHAAIRSGASLLNFSAIFYRLRCLSIYSVAD